MDNEGVSYGGVCPVIAQQIAEQERDDAQQERITTVAALAENNSLLAAVVAADDNDPDNGPALTVVQEHAKEYSGDVMATLKTLCRSIGYELEGTLELKVVHP